MAITLRASSSNWAADAAAELELSSIEGEDVEAILLDVVRLPQAQRCLRLITCVWLGIRRA